MGSFVERTMNFSSFRGWKTHKQLDNKGKKKKAQQDFDNIQTALTPESQRVL